MKDRLRDEHEELIFGGSVQPLSRGERILGWVAFAALIMVVAGCLALLWPRMANAARFDCADLAMLIGGAADFRDAGADLEKTLAIARERSGGHQGNAEHRVLEREIRRVWQEQLPRRRAIAMLYKRCRAQLGDMGAEG